MDDFNGRFNEDLIFSLLPRGARATIMKESNLSGSGRPDRGKNKKGGKPGMDTKRIALVPAYEPGEQLLMLLPQLTGAGLSVIVVDDGSGPDFAPLFQKAAEYGTVLTHPVNRGKGAALKTGYRWLSEHVAGPFTVVAVDADGHHRLHGGGTHAGGAGARRPGVSGQGAAAQPGRQRDHPLCVHPLHRTAYPRYPDRAAGVRPRAAAVSPQRGGRAV